MLLHQAPELQVPQAVRCKPVPAVADPHAPGPHHDDWSPLLVVGVVHKVLACVSLHHHVLPADQMRLVL